MGERTAATFFLLCLFKTALFAAVNCAFRMVVTVTSTLSLLPLLSQAFLSILLYVKWPLQVIAPEPPAWQECPWTHFHISCCQNHGVSAVFF